jgi:hypothetical protein
MEPELVVKNFISQVCQLYGQHSPEIDRIDQLAHDKNIPTDKRNEYNKQFWDAVRCWRREHKKLCEDFGFKITEHNFTEANYSRPLLYDKQKVVKVETLSPTKVKVFTKHARKKSFPLVFYLENKDGIWKATKVRRIDLDDKEFSPSCW